LRSNEGRKCRNRGNPVSEYSSVQKKLNPGRASFADAGCKTREAELPCSSGSDSGTTTSATTTYFQYGLNGELLWSDDGTTQEKYIYAHATIWAEVRTTGGECATYYHHTDHQGTTECITDAEGTVVWDASYEAYGKLVHENGTVSFKASFTGKQIDEDTGLYYFNARWYDAELGRFVTEDPARDGTNWYEYCRNNPLIYLDPSGLSTTRDDYAYQLRTEGHTEEAAAMERAAAEANNGYTQSSGPCSSDTSSQQKPETKENHSPSEAELSSNRGTAYEESINSEFISDMKDFWDRSKTWVKYTSDDIRKGDAKEIAEDLLQGLTGTTDPLEALDKILMATVPFAVPYLGTAGKVVSSEGKPLQREELELRDN